MAKKKFIRHLEFYGFPDQNIYASMGTVDLSDIRETNREQDEEISQISGITSEKADLSIVQELSAKTDSFIEHQTEIDRSLIANVSGNTERITALEETDEQVINKLNEVVSGLNEVNESVEDIQEKVNNLESAMTEHISSATTVIESLSGDVATVMEGLEGKLDKSEAEEIYAKKSEVYSREEADETFLKEHQDISNLATKDEVNAIQQEIDEIDFGKYALQSDLEAFETAVGEYETSANTRMDNIEDSVSSLNVSISGVNDKVMLVSGKTEMLSDSIEDIQTALDKKVSKQVFDNYVSDMEDTIDAINATKASKSELIILSGAVEEVSLGLSQEKAARQGADAQLDSKIDALGSEVDAVKASAETISENVSALNDRIDQEIQDRIDGDIALIGTSADTFNADTIWGAKKYALNQRTVAVAQAKEYTDDVFSGIETEITNQIDEIKTDLSGKADKDYVDASIDDKAEELSETLNSKIDNEISRATATENNLQYEIQTLRECIESGVTPDTKNIYKRLNVITTYSGDTPEEYVNTGNGVLDVLHREFHQLEDEIGVVINETLEKKNEHEVAFGNYNISNTGEEPSEQTAFSIGVGTSEEDRKNAVEIRKNGDLYLWIEGEFMQVNDLLAMLAHETYN